MKNKKILITGGCGFVAGRIAEVLGVDNDVVVVDNMRYWDDDKVVPSGVLHQNMNINEIDVSDGWDYIIHGATVNIIHGMSDPEACVDTNWNQTVQFFNGIPRSVQVLYLSTSSIYGNGVSIPTPETCRVAPSSTYAMTKLMAEMYLQANHPNCVIARLSNVYGPRQRPENPYSGVMVKMLESNIMAKPFKVYGDGLQTRDFTYVDDVVSACVALLEKGKRGEVYNIGSGVETSIAELMQHLHKDVDVDFVEGRAIDNITRRCLDIRKIKMDTGWEPRVNIRDGIAKTVVWLMGEGVFSR